MITIILQRDEAGMIHHFSASGHAGYADQGPDIICAAITALAASAIGSLQELADIDPERQLEDGLIRFSLPDPSGLTATQWQIASILMQSLVIGCRQIQISYGSRFIRFRSKMIKGGTKQ
ncbi:MAG: ribosomal-processing cysteine protease Prp [Bacillota bacterium]|nr:ribosomal-processing cysteine protease Prp [Bacillota bacterium]